MKNLDEQDLLDLKKDIDEAKTKKSELIGQKNALMTQLNNDWGCKTVEEAQKKLKTMGGEIEDIEDKIEKGVTDLQEKYNVE